MTYFYSISRGNHPKGRWSYKGGGGGVYVAVGIGGSVNVAVGSGGCVKVAVGASVVFTAVFVGEGCCVAVNVGASVGSSGVSVAPPGGSVVGFGVCDAITRVPAEVTGVGVSLGVGVLVSVGVTVDRKLNVPSGVTTPVSE